MLKIPLKTSWLRQHKMAARPVDIDFRSKYDRNAHRYEECLFLTQSGDRLVYTTCAERHAVQNWEVVDFQLSHPMAVNLSSVPYKLDGEYVWCEVPKCTMETNATFYDDARPKYIKDSDLQTNVVAINGKRANIEFIKPQRYVDGVTRIVQSATANPFYDHNQYQWFGRDADDKIDFYEISKIYRLVFGMNSISEYEYGPNLSNQVKLNRLAQIHNAATKYGTLERVTDNGVEVNKYHLPIAMFEGAKQTVIWQGIPVRIK